MQKKSIIFSIVIIVFFSCSPTDTERKKEQAIFVSGDTIYKEKSITKINEFEIEHVIKIEPIHDLPEIVLKANLPNSLLIDGDKILIADFNGDGIDDFASHVINSENGYHGLIIINSQDETNYQVFGTENTKSDMDNLDWIDIMELIPKGDTVAPTLFDPISGDILGADKEKEFKLLGNGIMLRVEGACGGGIVFWNGNRYEWYQI